MNNTTHRTYSLQMLFVAIILLAASIKSNATEAQIDASVTFTQALTIVAEELEFGIFEFSLNASANEITLSSSDDSITCSNTSEYTCPSSGKSGAIDIAGGVGSLINISCEPNGVVSNGSDTLTLTQVKLYTGTVETSCAGIGVPSISLALGGLSTQNIVKLGAKLIIPDTGVGSTGEYTTSNSGGQAIAVRVLYQ